MRKMAAEAFAPVIVRWISGHTGLAGNEIGDKLACRELTLPDNSSTPTDQLTLAAIRHESLALTRPLLKDWWASNRPKQYADLGLEMRRKKPPELSLPRAVYARLIAARTGHGDFAA